MDEIAWHRRETRRQTEKTNLVLELGSPPPTRQAQNFSPGCSPKALKRMGKVLRSWRLNRRTDKSLNELAHFYSVVIRGWIQYYGAYYKTALRPLLQRINRYLVRWAQRKYKRFRGHQRRATYWLRRIAYREPYLFPHWRLGAMP